MSFLVIGTTVQVSAQKSKDAKKYKLKAAKISSTITRDGKEVTVVELDERYDSEGNIIEEVDFDSEGAFKSKITRTFNKAGDPTEEAYYTSDGN